jgi:hypothetical protein
MAEDRKWIIRYTDSGRIIGPFDTDDLARAYAKERGGALPYEVLRIFVPDTGMLARAQRRVESEARAPVAVLVAFTEDEAHYVANLVGSHPAGAATEVATAAYRKLREFDRG